jgi:hypothetical protein
LAAHAAATLVWVAYHATSTGQTTGGFSAAVILISSSDLYKTWLPIMQLQSAKLQAGYQLL